MPYLRMLAFLSCVFCLGACFSIDDTNALEDTTPPVIADPALTFLSATTNSVTITWHAANDVITSQAALLYRVVGSTLSNIATVEEAQNNGFVVKEWTPDIQSCTAGNLEKDTEYFFCVVVKDQVGNSAAYTVGRQKTADVPDLTAPAPGGPLAFDLNGYWSLRVTWPAATDLVTAPGDLRYMLVRSRSADIGTVQDATNHGTVLVHWTKNVLSHIDADLTPGTTYHYNVLVRDTYGNIACYPQSSSSTVALVIGKIKIEGGSGSGAGAGAIRWHKVDTIGANLGPISPVLGKNLVGYWDDTFNLTDAVNPGTSFALVNNESGTTGQRTFTFQDPSGIQLGQLVIPGGDVAPLVRSTNSGAGSWDDEFACFHNSGTNITWTTRSTLSTVAKIKLGGTVGTGGGGFSLSVHKVNASGADLGLASSYWSNNLYLASNLTITLTNRIAPGGYFAFFSSESSMHIIRTFTLYNVKDTQIGYCSVEVGNSTDICAFGSPDTYTRFFWNGTNVTASQQTR